jgi:hypothetical protein
MRPSKRNLLRENRSALAMKLTAVPGISEPYRLPVYLACTVLAVVTNYLLGKDMAPDMLNYHLYAGFNAVHDRFAQDYFPAGPNSYFNPYVFVPLYYLAKSGMSSLGVSTALAIVHSVVLWLTFELALTVCTSRDGHTRLMFGLCAVAFALVNPILLQQIGSTFADITTGELVLAGWLLLALSVRAPRRSLILYAGLACGIATGLKLTNAVHAIAGFTIVVMLPLTLWGRIRQAIAYGIALGLGYLIFAAPWSYRLERRFGNPLFPLMNNIFRSPELSAEPARAMRFIPETVAEALWRPFAMIDPVPMVHEEPRAPDPRYAVLLIVIVALVCRWLWRRRAVSSSQSVNNADAASARTLTAIGFGLAVDWALWLSGSGNSRYFLPMSSVAAVVVVALLYRLFPVRQKARGYILAGILGLQGVQLWMGADYRWNGTPWDEHWINIAVPAKLKSEAALYLTMGVQTNSFVAPYLSPGAGLINLSGLYTLGPDGANGARIAAMIDRYAPRIRMLVRGERLYSNDELRTPNRAQIDDILQPFGLRVDESDCATIAVSGLPPDLQFTLASAKPQVLQSRDTTYLLSCRVVPDNTDYSAQLPARRNIDLALDHLEDACPALFQPRRPRTEYIGGGGFRRYGGTDLSAWVSHGSVKFLQPSLGGDVVILGAESDWARASIGIRCGRRNGRYFVVLPGAPR